MPASMMSAVAGWSANVDGKSSAIAPTGPMPGSMPTTVPTKTPMKHATRFAGVSATVNPYASPSSGPISASPWSARQRDVEEHGEEIVRGRGAQHAEGEGGHPAAAEPA